MATTLDLSSESVREIAKTDLARATEMARQLVAANPDDEDMAKLLGDVVRRFARETPPISTNAATGPVGEAARLIDEGNEEQAELLLRAHLARHPDDVPAMVLMADIAARCEFYENAEKILRRALEIDAKSVEALLTMAKLSSHLSLVEHRDRGDAALALVERALDIDPSSSEAVSLQSSIFVRFRRLDEAIPSYRRLFELEPLQWLAWANFGTMLNSLGHLGDAVAALRTSVAINPAYGFGWWELANLKLAKLFEFDITEMRRVLDRGELDDVSRSQIHFALAKALHQFKRFADAAHHLEEGNRTKRALHPHDPVQITADVSKSIDFFTPDHFERTRDQGDPSADPIFIVGMPRSGSTLVEQILASHPAVEGTEELFLILRLAVEFSERNQGRPWQEGLAKASAAEIRMLGTRFLQLARHYRKTERPFFIDKNPANWRFVGLIATMLPNAKFIDVRRNPMDCCFANYSQYFESGVAFTYSQRNLGLYYSDYVRLMRHFADTRPGLVHRVIYDDLVDDLETAVRRLLDHLGLPFEEACLRFFETERAVLTPSAQQVRQPINRSGIGRWEPYEPWLGELKEALGSTLDDWRK